MIFSSLCEATESVVHVQEGLHTNRLGNRAFRLSAMLSYKDDA